MKLAIVAHASFIKQTVPLDAISPDKGKYDVDSGKGGIKSGSCSIAFLVVNILFIYASPPLTSPLIQ